MFSDKATAEMPNQQLQPTAARRGRLTVMVRFKHDSCRPAAGSAAVAEHGR